jgi:transcriptional regulator with XRE-family HTH domain
MLSAPDLLRDARRTAGLTQAQLAERLGVSQSEIARLEKRGANPRLGTLLEAIRAAGFTLEARVKPRRGTVDETMIAANLRLTPAERLAHFTAAYNSIRELAPTRRGRDGSQGQASG